MMKNGVFWDVTPENLRPYIASWRLLMMQDEVLIIDCIYIIYVCYWLWLMRHGICFCLTNSIFCGFVPLTDQRMQINEWNEWIYTYIHTYIHCITFHGLALHILRTATLNSMSSASSIGMHRFEGDLSLSHEVNGLLNVQQSSRGTCTGPSNVPTPSGSLEEGSSRCPDRTRVKCRQDYALVCSWTIPMKTHCETVQTVMF
jgi:hypothetical protein